MSVPSIEVFPDSETEDYQEQHSLVQLNELQSETSQQGKIVSKTEPVEEFPAGVGFPVTNGLRKVVDYRNEADEFRPEIAAVNEVKFVPDLADRIICETSAKGAVRTLYQTGHFAQLYQNCNKAFKPIVGEQTATTGRESIDCENIPPSSVWAQHGRLMPSPTMPSRSVKVSESENTLLKDLSPTDARRSNPNNLALGSVVNNCLTSSSDKRSQAAPSLRSSNTKEEFLKRSLTNALGTIKEEAKKKSQLKSRGSRSSSEERPPTPTFVIDEASQASSETVSSSPRKSSLKSPKKARHKSCDLRRCRFADEEGKDLMTIKPISPLPSPTPTAKHDTAFWVGRKYLQPLFPKPIERPMHLKLKLQKNSLVLSDLETDLTTLDIKGRVKVRNLDYHKSVYVRYSTDDWKTMAEVQADYVPWRNPSLPHLTDDFTFVIRNLRCLSPGRRVAFAVRLHCIGDQFWDNNDTMNYVIECRRETKKVSQSEMLPIDKVYKEVEEEKHEKKTEEENGERTEEKTEERKTFQF